jgi:DNA-binding NtrC family response regulator
MTDTSPKKYERKIRVLCIDDEVPMVEGCRRLLHSFGYEVITATEGNHALELIESESPDIVLADLRMPGIDGLTLLETSKKLRPEIIFILFTAYATIPSAVEAVKKGAFDYVTKPFSAEQMEIVLAKAVRYRRLVGENKVLRAQLRETFDFANIVGQSPPMLEVFEMIRKVAATEANIFVSGESGTGKELVARSIHANSPRFNHPFVPVDCASLPETLLESELFGHEKGAFTGAYITRPGLFEYANGGTVFLDEVGELASNIQAKLLRVLQEHKVRRVGGREEIDVDIRIISASNRDLKAAVDAKDFREDLFYRLNVISIPLPPLRDRGNDIDLLVAYFLNQFGKSMIKPAARISDEAMVWLKQYGWPGNIRELQNVIERALSLCEGEVVLVSDLPEHIRNGETLDPTDPMELPLREARRHWLAPLEKEYLKKLLEKHNYNISQSARAAEIDRQTIYRLLKKYGIEVD